MDVHKEYTPAIYTPDIKAVRQHSHALREEKEEMKKTYTKITVLICALITVVMLLGCALFTYVKVSEVNDTYMQRYSGLKEFSYEYRADTDLGDAIIGAYSTWEIYFSMSAEDVGYYGEFMWSDETGGPVHTIPREDFVSIYYYDPDHTESEGSRMRIMKPDDDFGYGQEERLWNVSLDAGTDDVFVYDGTVSYHRVGKGDSTVTTSVPEGIPYVIGDYTDTWGEGRELYATYVPVARSAAQAKLNEEAKNTLHEVLAGNNLIKLEKQGFFTSYTMNFLSYKLDDTFTYNREIFFFHPFRIALSSYWYIYFLFLVVMISLNVLCIFIMRRLYLNRRNYEARTQKLVRSVAHELKTPLAVTKAYTENWEYIDDKDRPEVAAKINAEVDHMAKMVNTLLELSKMEAGDMKLKLEEVEIFELTKTCYRHIEPIAKERGISVEFIKDKDDAEYLVMADLDMMKMVISNFLSNAVKYGKKRVEIRFLKSGNNVTFKITNDGQTISAKDQKRIWDLFYKTDNSGSDRLNSTGIGLAVNKSILELHKAKYGVWSGTGNTIFWFDMKGCN